MGEAQTEKLGICAVTKLYWLIFMQRAKHEFTCRTFKTTKIHCGCCQVALVVSNSVWPHRRQPTMPRCPWDSPGKNTGVGFHFLLQSMKVKSESEVAQSCLTQRPHRLQPTRLLRPWDFLGKSTGVGCHALPIANSTLIFKGAWMEVSSMKVPRIRDLHTHLWVQLAIKTILNISCMSKLV